MREDEAPNAGLSPQATSLAARHLAQAAVSHRPQGIIKLASEIRTDRLLGAHVVLPNGGDIISEATLAIPLRADRARRGPNAPSLPHLGRGDQARSADLHAGCREAFLLRLGA